MGMIVVEADSGFESWYGGRRGTDIVVSMAKLCVEADRGMGITVSPVKLGVEADWGRPGGAAFGSFFQPSASGIGGSEGNFLFVSFRFSSS